MKDSTKIRYCYPAIFWDGNKQLFGKIQLIEFSVKFIFEDFKNSNLNLTIPYDEIESVKIILIFEIAKNGLRIKSKSKKINTFVLENCNEFYTALQETIKENVD